MTVLLEIRRRFRQALATVCDAPDEFTGLIGPAQDPRFGDYQANVAMPLAKRLAQPPRKIADALVAAVQLDDLCHPPEIAGPGFINLRLRDDWVVQRLGQAARDPRLGVDPVNNPRTFVVDFSSPNVAKPMHVGHIRSTVIGDALAKTLRFVGHRVITDNHLGDWGTQFGMIIFGYKHLRNDDAYRRNPIEHLSSLYRWVRQAIDWQQAKQQAAAREEPPKIDPVAKALAERVENIEEAVLAETAKLHAGDSENLQLWREFLPACRADIQCIYQRLDIQFDHELGESFYHNRLPHIVEDLRRRGLARESEGALCVFLDGFETPMIVQKKDGAFLYSTSDLATIEYRMTHWQPDVVLYVVDHRQHEHFEKLFAAARVWGYDRVDLRHISFGTVLGEDGRPFKTRSGDTVGLEELLDEAEQRAMTVLQQVAEERESPLNAAQQALIARVVGIGALKYADLSQNRQTDYKFSFSKMLELKGNTATYLQYLYARVQGIYRKAGLNVEALRNAAVEFDLATDIERQLALGLLRFGEALDDVLLDYRPNILAQYLFDLAQTFFKFYNQCSVLQAETAALRQSRLQLCDLTARVVRQGLALLGIDVVDQM